jgi:hypothetical protein
MPRTVVSAALLGENTLDAYQSVDFVHFSFHQSAMPVEATASFHFATIVHEPFFHVDDLMH